jgi:hypothetical protein
MAAVDVPHLIPGHTPHTGTSQPATALPQLLEGLLGHTGSRAALATGAQSSTQQAPSSAGPGASMHHDPSKLDAELEGTVAQAVEQVQAAVAGGALLEVVHWEMECGLQVRW